MLAPHNRRYCVQPLLALDSMDDDVEGMWSCFRWNCDAPYVVFNPCRHLPRATQRLRRCQTNTNPIPGLPKRNPGL